MSGPSEQPAPRAGPIQLRLVRAFVPLALGGPLLTALLCLGPGPWPLRLAMAAVAGLAAALAGWRLASRIGEELDRAQALLLQVEARLRAANTGLEHRNERARELERWAKRFELESWGVAWVDARDGRLLFANGALASLWATSPQALLGRHATELVEHALGDELVAELRSALERGTVQVELLARRQDGTTFPAAFNLAAQGTTVVLSVGDLTEQRRAAQRTRQQLERGSAIIRAALDCIVSVDAQGRVIEFNPAAERTFGLRRAEALGRPLAEVLLPVPSPGDPPHPLLLSLVAGGPVGTRLETVARHASGRLFPVEVAVGELQGAAGPERVGFFRDITERRQAEHELRKWETVFEQAGLGIAICVMKPGGELIIDVANPCYARMHGYEVEELRGMPARQLRATEAERTTKFALDLEALGRSGHVTVESLRQHKSGSQFSALVDAAEVRSGSGAPTTYVVAVQDISPLRQAVDALLQAKEAAEAANRAKSDFLARMSHELRTPLNAIIGFGELLQGEAAQGSRQQAQLGHIVQAGHHLLGVINDLLDLAKVEAGRDELFLEPTDPQQTAADALALIEPLAAAKKITMHLRPLPASPQPAPKLWLDRGKLRQVLFNLLSNAVKFTHAGGRVEVAVELDWSGDVAAGCRVRVSDTGIGIAAEDQRRLFQPFVQLDSSLARAQKGTGLGLVLAARLVELHGGSITLESAQGRGSTFTFSLPAQAPARPPSTSGVASVPPATAAQRVLIVDDSAPNAALASEILVGAGYQVFIARDAQEALSLATQEQPALVLMDLAMPGVDGLEATRRLRDRPATRHIPVVAWTAHAMGGQVERALEAGCQACLTKPVTSAGLLHQVQLVLRGQPDAARH